MVVERARQARRVVVGSAGEDRLGFGWQLTQGQYALGTGGLFGVGLGASREKWGSLPEAHTDFIFSAFAEEHGFIGVVVVLAILGLLAGLAIVVALIPLALKGVPYRAVGAAVRIEAEGCQARPSIGGGSFVMSRPA